MEVKLLSYLIDSLLPEYIKTDYPLYVSFITKYLELLEEEGAPFAVLNSLTDFIDVSITPEETLAEFVNQYLHSFPVELLEEINVREFITNSKDFYSRKGNESAVRFIFNILGGKINFYYPSAEIFELNKSVLSGNIIGSGLPVHKLHDNYFYAYYVYEVESDLDHPEYEEILREMTHPIGEKLFFKKLIYISNTGEIFDANAISDTLLYLDHQWIFESPTIAEQQQFLYLTNILNFKIDTFSDIIEDHFFAVTGDVIEDYFDISVYDILFEELLPASITYEVKNTDISFENSDSSINNTNPTTDTDFSVFSDGETITILGSTGNINDGVFTISGSPTASKIIVTTSITTQSAGPSVTINND